jgi:hypothetical protein
MTKPVWLIETACLRLEKPVWLRDLIFPIGFLFSLILIFHGQLSHYYASIVNNHPSMSLPISIFTSREKRNLHRVKRGKWGYSSFINFRIYFYANTTYTTTTKICKQWDDNQKSNQEGKIRVFVFKNLTTVLKIFQRIQIFMIWIIHKFIIWLDDFFIGTKERYQGNHRLVNPDCSTGQVGSSKYIKSIMVII